MKKGDFIEVKREVQFSDMMALQKDLEKFEQKRYGGKLVSRLEQFLESLGYCRILSNGDIHVKDAVGYKWFIEIDEELKSYERREMEKAGTLPKFDYKSIRFTPKTMPVHDSQTEVPVGSAYDDPRGDPFTRLNMGLEGMEPETDDEDEETDEDESEDEEEF